MNKLKLAVISGFIAFNSYTAVADTTVTDDSRWFEVEIIVFKSTSNSGLFEESWRKDTQLTQVENLIDFVQPFDEISLNTINNTSNPAVQLNDQENNSNKPQTPVQEPAPINDSTNTQATTVKSTINETPFILLPDESRQLTNEAKSLEKHPDYHVLLHQAWRQPVLNSQEAPHIRIAGGKDFSAEYQYDGSKISSLSYSEENIEESTSIDNNNSNTIADNSDKNNITNQVSTNSSLTTNDKHPLTSTNQLNDSNQLVKFVRKPWVPELDGDIKVYLNRYLHVKTNLYLRRPDKEEIEVINLDMLKDRVYPTMDQSTTLTPQTFQSTNMNAPNSKQSTNELDNLLTGNKQLMSSSAKQSPESLTVSKKAQFSWEIGDDFLETESEKLYIERLFNYSLKQSRKIKSGELHFFDHPLIGVLIMIRPYTIEPANPQDLPTLSSSF